MKPPGLIQRFKHHGASVWNGELFGHDVTIARKHGQPHFQIWVDGKNIGHRRSLEAAEKLALGWVK